MEVTSITDGVIIDHVPSGTALKVLRYLDIDPTQYTIALIMNATSKKYGSKDIIKIENIADINLDVLGLVAPQATVCIIRDSAMVKKLHPTKPEHIVNVLRCVNPRCVTSSERGIDQRFHLTHTIRSEYRCDYCDEEAKL